ncbi:MAG: hypothetical protein K2N18_03475, partial [Clostridia bacterium]|nr:hypothetical protein [Clostridia bacterium]
MHRGRLSEDTKPRHTNYTFHEGEFTVTLTKDGAWSKSKGQKGRLIPYGEGQFYRAVERSSASRRGRDKLYFTAPVSAPCNYNRFCFKKEGVTYLTHEFSEEERKRIELALSEYNVPVIDKRVKASVIVKPYKTFCEDGGLIHRIVGFSIAFLAALLLGTLIAVLLNYFLHTDTESLAYVFAIFCVPCLLVVLIKAQELGSKVKIYDKGVYLKIRGKSGVGGTVSPFAIQKTFFTWGEVESVELVQSQVRYLVTFRLGYCVYSMPDFNGLYEYIARN